MRKTEHIVPISSQMEWPLGTAPFPLPSPILQSFRLSFHSAESRDPLSLQGSAKMLWPGLVNCVPAITYHFCLSLPAAFTQPGQSLLAEPCTLLVIWLFDKVKTPQVVNMRIYKSGDRRTRHFGSGARIKPVLNKGPFIKDVP